ncbi:hypothetical protein [Pseudomonas fluorescens]|uniref:Uncharacterized protein n=1 Tax=Pseudomonas fluorescens TaxID=294 RepID=A0A5E7DWM6_PSEFL|nr:hypothetical protein [Pseudomonas fluorescens]VVO13184.1 hypothetical protein PS723_03590 [Pseudomonas fluorescens]
MASNQRPPDTENPDEALMPGEVERDNDALRPNGPAKRRADINPDDQDLDDLKENGRHL